MADFEEAVSKLHELEHSRDVLDVAIAKQKKRVAALHELVQNDENVPSLKGLVDGLTDACRVVLRAAGKPMYPVEIKEKVERLGLPPQSNLLASVYTTLRRMKEAGEIREDFSRVQPGGGAVLAYAWAGETVAMNLRGRQLELEAMRSGQSLRPQERFSLKHTKESRQSFGQKIGRKE